MALCNSSAFGNNNNYIKFSNDNLIAVQGSDIINKMILGSLRIPYNQVSKSRIILKPGQTNYFLNHMAFGDNLTFLAISASYNSESIYEEENFINWSYYDDMAKIYSFSHVMVLTGNSTNRIKQMYLTNPNPDYAVTLEVMYAIIDDEYSFFADTLNQQGTTFVNLDVTDIKTHLVGESIVIYDKNDTPRPLIYLNLSDIQSLRRSVDILIIDDSTLGSVYLHFTSEEEAGQAHSLLSYVLSNDNIDINSMVDVYDNDAPVIYFKSQVGDTGDYILMGSTGTSASVPYDTSMGTTFSTSIGLSGYSGIDSSLLSQLLVDNIVDSRDGTMSTSSSFIMINDDLGNEIELIGATGNYSLAFNVSDLALNDLNDIIFNLNII